MAKALRKAGNIPAIYYSHGQENIALSVNRKNFFAAFKSDAQLINLSMDKGKSLPTIIREIQWDPVTGEPLHVDFMGVKMDEKVSATVPIHLVGEAIGVKEQGGILQFTLRQVDIECLPMDIPEAVELDISHLNLHDTIHVSDIVFEKGEVVSDGQSVVASITAPKLAVETGEEEAGEPTVVSAKEGAESEE